MSTHVLRILNLYPRQMNLYGDIGNLLALRKRCEWRSIPVETIHFEPGDDIALLSDIDIILGGGAQESGQSKVHKDIVRIAPQIHKLIEDDVPALVVCACYQLFGEYYETPEGSRIEGAGVFSLYTRGGTVRNIGNTVASSSDFGELIGYENHIGKSYLRENLQPLGQVVQGVGNNGEDGTEGARYRNALGTYLHGPLLPKNPVIADYLIATALARHTGVLPQLAPLPGADQWVGPARLIAKSRPR